MKCTTCQEREALYHICGRCSDEEQDRLNGEALADFARIAELAEINAEYQSTIAQQQVDVANAEARAALLEAELEQADDLIEIGKQTIRDLRREFTAALERLGRRTGEG